jgi:hypothetical protein
LTTQGKTIGYAEPKRGQQFLKFYEKDIGMAIIL